MAFAIAINNLIEVFGKPGCPVCRIFRQASERALESFLWENVNEPDIRQGILDSYGFCPSHTRVMVAREIFTSSVPLGTNIVYEHLGRVVARELKSLKPNSLSGSANQLFSGFRRWLQYILKGQPISTTLPLHPRGVCPACQAGENAAFNSLHVLCEEVQKEGDVRNAYLKSDGLCLGHLRAAFENLSNRYPQSISFLLDETARRLETQSKNMKEYIRKNNWAYRDEKLTEEEDTAWRKTLTFFTGYPGSTFTHRVDEF